MEAAVLEKILQRLEAIRVDVVATRKETAEFLEEMRAERLRRERLR
jgi:phage-related minor tail protein